MHWLGILYIVWVMAYLVPMQNRSFFFLEIQETVFMSEAISHGDGAETGAFGAAIPQVDRIWGIWVFYYNIRKAILSVLITIVVMRTTCHFRMF